MLSCKVVLLGSSGVGKTSIVIRYVQSAFAADQQATIGASFWTKRLHFVDNSITLQIWDTAGQERYRSITPMYYRGAQAAILVFDVTNIESFENAQSWIEELKQSTEEDLVLVIAANKADLPKAKWVITVEDIQRLVNSVGGSLFQTSAKLGTGIDEMFVDIAKQLMESHNTYDSTSLETNPGCAC
eukprot:TRINITY_DN1310_c0_g1_i8.p1 TRINITY_DN1310_c0_g1~~TRINITY_DN1310_c0_g1_i8.p1  ORF type:complete len:186 (-),score=22.96 TRINITY_DN1310_c0_g1_i8:213-770(-)